VERGKGRKKVSLYPFRGKKGKSSHLKIRKSFQLTTCLFSRRGKKKREGTTRGEKARKGESSSYAFFRDKEERK